MVGGRLMYVPVLPLRVGCSAKPMRYMIENGRFGNRFLARTPNISVYRHERLYGGYHKKPTRERSIHPTFLNTDGICIFVALNSGLRNALSDQKRTSD